MRISRVVIRNFRSFEHLYFVVETKSSLFKDDLRDKESAKIECGRAHFKALAVGDNPARYVVATKFDDLMASAELSGG